MQYLLVTLIVVLLYLKVDDRKDLFIKCAIALFILVLYFWAKQNP